MEEITLYGITLTVVTILLIVVVLYAIRAVKNKGYKKKLEYLDIEKNKISGTPIVPELAKVENYKNNDKINIMYKEWKGRLDDINEFQIPRITDMLLEADYTLSQMDYKSTLYKIAKLEMEIYKVRTNAEFLLDEIRDLTTSEERNRMTITKLKTRYRELFERFNSTKGDYGSISESISLQFENIAKKFEDFEKVVENSQIQELNQINDSIEEMLDHMTVIIEEMPSIVLLAVGVIPKKIEEIKRYYDAMTKAGYPLDYLNVEYNIDEAKTKLKDIMTRAKHLNIEESLLILKVLNEYFEGLINDFEKEKTSRKTYEETLKSFDRKLTGINKLVSDIFKQLKEIKNLYDLNDKDIEILNKIKEELKKLNTDHKVLVDHTGNGAFAYSKLCKELDVLVVRLSAIEESLDSTLDTIGAMKDDEARAREQLEEVKLVLKNAKSKMREYNFPHIPDSYFVELSEAQAAIKEIILELDKKPISINTLNTRVDTARDLVLKLFSKTKEMIKTAKFSEMAIVYGNRYRSEYDDLDRNLAYSEMLFFKGEYQKSLELSIKSLNAIEPGIYDKLIGYYGNEKI